MKFLCWLELMLNSTNSDKKTSACTDDGDKELRNGSKIWPPILKAASETTVDTEIANTCCATLERILYFVALHLHQLKISNLKLLGSSQSSPKYLSTSFFFGHRLLPLNVFWIEKLSHPTYHHLSPLNQH